MCIRDSHRLLRNKLISRNTKIKIYKKLIKPVIYGGETWALTKKEQETLRRFERKTVRSVYGPVKEDD